MTDVGATGHAGMTVTETDSSAALGSGDLAVLATPALAALMERAAMAALRNGLEPAQTTVGVRLDIRHSTATLVGGRVTATARLIRRKGRLLLFAVTAADEEGSVAEAAHHRVIVDRDNFMSKARRRHG